jgi:hypothetical protein
MPWDPKNSNYLNNFKTSQVPVAYACNPSYLGGKRLGGSQFEASLGKYFTRPCLKNTEHKIGLVE